MSKKLIASALFGALLLPAAAQAQQRVPIPNVELFATVTGKWVLDPRRCRDIREDVRDARVTESRRDRREDRRDTRVADCPPSAYDFIVDAGQGPKHPVRVGRGRVQRKYRGRPMFRNGDTIGPDGLPVGYSERIAAPRYNQPVIQQPRYQQQPTYPQPQTYQYQPAPNSTYQGGVQTYDPAPAPQPAPPSNYEIRDGVIYWLD